MSLTKALTKAFISGSSLPAFITFFIGFWGKRRLVNQQSSCVGPNVYHLYTLAAPLYIGLMSVLALILHHATDLSLAVSFFLIGILSASISSVIITKCRGYNFTPNQLSKHYIRLQLLHFLTYSGIILTIYNSI